MADVTKLPVRHKGGAEKPTLEVTHHSDSCQHRHFLIDEKLAMVECADCGTALSPMWVLVYLAGRENSWTIALEQGVRHESSDNRERYAAEMKRLAERSRTKCQHCGKMTEISRR